MHADVTVTFGALKTGLLVGAGATGTGEVRFVDIGLDATLPAADAFVLEAADVAARLHTPGPSDDKYTRGVTGVVAGSAAYPGAGVLATGAAICGGAGMVRYAGTAADAIRARYPEVVVQEGATPSELRVQAWVIGPGIGTDDAARAPAGRRPVHRRPGDRRCRCHHRARRGPGTAAGAVGRDRPHAARPRVRPHRRRADRRSARQRPSCRRDARGDRPVQGRDHGRGRTRRPGLDQPHRHAVARHGRQRRRPQRPDRLVARRRTRPARGRGGRCVRPRRGRPARRHVRAAVVGGRPALTAFSARTRSRSADHLRVQDAIGDRDADHDRHRADRRASGPRCAARARRCPPAPRPRSPAATTRCATPPP